jgi:hypothetical protein
MKDRHEYLVGSERRNENIIVSGTLKMISTLVNSGKSLAYP